MDYLYAVRDVNDPETPVRARRTEIDDEDDENTTICAKNGMRAAALRRPVPLKKHTRQHKSASSLYSRRCNGDGANGDSAADYSGDGADSLSALTASRWGSRMSVTSSAGTGSNWMSPVSSAFSDESFSLADFVQDREENCYNPIAKNLEFGASSAAIAMDDPDQVLQSIYREIMQN